MSLEELVPEPSILRLLWYQGAILACIPGKGLELLPLQAGAVHGSQQMLSGENETLQKLGQQ